MKTEYIRDRHVIYRANEQGDIERDVHGHPVVAFEGKAGDRPSINAAKRHSRTLQTSGLGRGQVRVYAKRA